MDSRREKEKDRMHLTRGLIAALILSLSASTYAADYTVTVPAADDARVQTAVSKAYRTTVAQALADFLKRCVVDIETKEAKESAAKTAEDSAKADAEAIAITTK